MISWPNLYSEVIQKPYDTGLSRLDVITGFASSAFVHHVLYTLEELHLDIVLGMVKLKPITIWDHNEFVKLVIDTGRLRVRYFLGNPPIHAKALLWEASAAAGKMAYAGSANFSWNGFRDLQEIAVPIDPDEFDQFIVDPRELIDCMDPGVFQHLQMSYQREPGFNDIDTSAVGAVVRGRQHVELPLTMRGTSEPHRRAGLNWGQRPGREPNQGYIPIPRNIHRYNPGFFPDRGVEFNVITDDGESFICVVAQDNDKAVETSHDNSILGKYFRRRLGVAFGDPVTEADLQGYGRDSVDVYKFDNGTYFLEFSQRRGASR